MYSCSNPSRTGRKMRKALYLPAAATVPQKQKRQKSDKTAVSENSGGRKRLGSVSACGNVCNHDGKAVSLCAKSCVRCQYSNAPPAYAEQVFCCRRKC